MKFIIAKEVFEKLPNLCIGVVVAKGIDNTASYPEITSFLENSIAKTEAMYQGKKVKEEKEILPYREAFTNLGINPNKFMCSIEALATRIGKGKGMPHINPLVDLNNAVSLKYILPMGTHDLSISENDVEIRFAKEGDTFIPFGSTEAETPDMGELVYVVGTEVRTRRWTWRQSEQGKIDENTNYVFFPIDGFVGVNDDVVHEATKTLLETVKTQFKCEVTTGFLDKDNRELDLSL